MRNILHSQPPGDNVLEHVAANIRQLRTHRGISQDELARRAGLSRRTVNAVETGNANISLANLDHVAAALGVTFVDLVRPPSAPEARIEALMWQSDSGASRAVLLAAAPARAQVELWTWTLAPGERYDAEPDAAGFSEMLYVLEGELQLAMDGETRTIAAGGFHVFDSARRYAYVNAGGGPVRFVRNVVS